jgi:hypothetical protein
MLTTSSASYIRAARKGVSLPWGRWDYPNKQETFFKGVATWQPTRHKTLAIIPGGFTIQRQALQAVTKTNGM